LGGIAAFFAVAALVFVLAACSNPTDGDDGSGLSSSDQEQVDGFKNDETVKEALEKPAAEIGLDVPAGDLSSIEAKVDEALEEYGKLSEEAQEALAEEKAQLDAVKEKIGNVNDARDFQGDYGAVLAKAPEDIKNQADAAAILPELDKALEEAAALPSGVKELLRDDIAVLESLKAKADEVAGAPPPNPNEAAAAGFRNDHAGILAKTTETITVSLADEQAVDAALAAYSGLSSAVKALLSAEYQKLTGLKAKIGTLKTSSYTITFDSQGGSPVEEIRAAEGTLVSEPAAPTRSNDIFLGWYDTANGGTEYAWPHTLDADITMYAQWEFVITPPQPLGTKTIIIDFNYNDIRIEGDNGSNIIYQTSAYPKSVTLKAMNDYTDVKWYVDGDGNPVGTGNSITLTASDYSAKRHSVTFTGKNGGNLYSQIITFTVKN
jgi:uncharacterized repeat protein (TIGR02543 family)